MFKKVFCKNNSFIQKAYVSMSLLDEPFCALFLLLPFILKKDLQASAFQIAFLASLRPVVSCFSFYWTSNLKRRPDKLLTNLMGAWLLARLPFIFFPFFQSVWYCIFAAGIYQLFSRASMPALMEILKQNFEKDQREKLVSTAYLCKFLESAFLAFALGWMLDKEPTTWTFLFPIFTLLSFTTLFLQRKMILPKKVIEKEPQIKINRLIQPWKDSFSLLKKNPKFARFQWGFMIGGFGLMMIAPSREFYFVEILGLCYQQVCFGKYLFMGLGVLFSTPCWQLALRNFSIERVMFIMLTGFSLFPLSLLIGSYHLSFFYLAFFLYGIAQAGSHLLWNLSGTYFSLGDNSAKYSTVNLHMVGIRGLIGPSCGAILSYFVSHQLTLLIGSCICFIGAGYLLMTRKSRLFVPQAIKAPDGSSSS